MDIQQGKGITEYGPGIAIDLTGDEVALAIMAFLVAREIFVSGPQTITVNGEKIKGGHIYVDPSGKVIVNGEEMSGRAEAEVTYSIGDRFNYLDKEDLILARICGRIGLVNLSTGGNWGKNYSSQVEDCNRITPKEMERIWNGSSCTRTWDARKQCKVGEK